MLRLTAVACKALVRCAITAAAFFGVVFGVVCVGTWCAPVLREGLCGVKSAQAHVIHPPSRLCERCHCCVTRSQDFWLFSVSHMGIHTPVRPCQFLHRLLHAASAWWR